jgi:hypothetical protein
VQTVAVAAGVPIGVVAAQWGWRSVEVHLGLVTTTSIPWATIVLAVAGALAICVVATLTGRVAGTPDTVEALHSE